MKISKRNLRQIIKETLEDEYKEAIIDLFKNGQPQQAEEMAKMFGSYDFFAGMSMAGFDLSHFNMSQMNLSGANMRGVSLNGTQLVGANLSGVNLSSQVGEKYTIGYQTNFENADLSGANLLGARFRKANLKNIKYDESTKWPKGFAL